MEKYIDHERSTVHLLHNGSILSRTSQEAEYHLPDGKSLVDFSSSSTYQHRTHGSTHFTGQKLR